MSLAERDRRTLDTVFHPRLVDACQTNQWYSWKGFNAVSCFSTVQQEYFALRNAAGLFDLSPMTKYRISGPQAQAYLDRLVTRNLADMEPGRVRYCVWCNDEGRVLDDGTVFRLDAANWRLCSQERHLDWLLWAAIGFDVEIEDETESVTGLALQGPTSCRILRQAGCTGIEKLAPFRLDAFRLGDVPVVISRTGFTGDLGYEIWFAPEHGLAAWDRLVEHGADFGLIPIGAQALDMARIEAGFIQAGVDFMPAEHVADPSRSRSPYELGLGWLVDLRKPHFNGRRALAEEQGRGSRYRLLRLDIEGNKPAHDSFIYGTRNRVVGSVTSATWSPSAKANVALASVKMPWGRAGDRLHAEIYFRRELQWGKVMARCRVVEGPFFDPPRRRETPAPDR